MAESNRDRINPSLLDRLTDDAPGTSAPGRGGQGVSVSELRKSVLRDLNWLFNATQVLDPDEAEAWPQAKSSVVNFGLPPLSGRSASGVDVSQLERALRQAIIDFEPRILPDSVSVKALVDREIDHHNVLALHIEGLLWAQPVPVQLLLRTQLDLETGQSRVEETTLGRR
jgi:type VI secretion system protein ImpF